MSRTNETKDIKWHESVSVNVDQMQAFAIIHNVGMMINVSVNVKN